MKESVNYCLLVIMMIAGLAFGVSITEITKKNLKRNITIATIGLIIFIGGTVLKMNFL